MKFFKTIFLYILALFICPKETAIAINGSDSLEEFETRLSQIVTT